MPLSRSKVFFFTRSCTSPRGAALSLLRWLLCALAPAWLCWSSSLAAAATFAAASADVTAGGVSAGSLDAGSADAPSAGEEGAPMCDPRGASVAALPEVPEVDHGKLEQLPCDDAWLRWLGSTLEHARAQASARDGVPPAPPVELQLARLRMDGVLPFVIVMPSRAEPVRLPRSEVAGLAARPGHRFSIYRPPARGR